MSTYTATSSLPASDQKRFNQIVQCYEKKAYKKGIKWADQLLKKYPAHAESISMKGLIFTCIGKKDEGVQLAKNGLRIGLASHVCWHVLGLIHRMDKNYQEAMKCYKNALRIQSDNQQILRDLCLLQVQIRDLDGLRATRHQLLDLKPQVKISWIGLAIAYHLLGNHDLAVYLLETYDSNDQSAAQAPDPATLKDKFGWPKPLDFERSEALLYKCSILQEAGRYADALKALDQARPFVADVRSWKEMKGQLHLRLGERVEAEVIYRGLVEENSNNKAYLEGLERCINPAFLEQPLSEETEQKRLAFYKELTTKYPQSGLFQRAPLNFATGDRFRALADAYLQRRLRKGIPSIFTDVRALYKDAAKVAVFEELVNGYLTNLAASKSFTAESSAPKETSEVLVWTKFFAAMHFDARGMFDVALRYIDEAIEHTPTLIDLYTNKAKILKHAGSVKEAADTMVIAKDLDTADKYLNSACAKYQMRDGRVDAAAETLKFFNKDVADHVEHLSEMQCMWFELERGYAFQGLEQNGRALKYFHLVEKHFQDIYEDQFDFHTYCMRKMTIRDYVKLLRLEDNIRYHKFFFKAAQGAIRTYLALFDKAHEVVQPAAGEEAVDEKERKKALSKQRRAQAKAQAESKDVGKDGASSSKDEKKDDSGDSYVTNIQPMDEALKFLTSLKTHSPNRIETHLLAFEIYLRREKPVMMLQALKKASRIDASNAELHKKIVVFAQKYADASSLNPVVASIVKEELGALLNGASAAKFNADFLAANSTKFLHVVRGAEAQAILSPDAKPSALKLILGALSNPAVKDRTYKNAVLAFETVKGVFRDAAAVQQFTAEAHKSFPLAALWQPPAPSPAAN